MEFGSLYFPTSLEDTIKYAERIEQTSFSKLWIVDSQQLYYDSYVTLAICASATEDIELAPGVTNPISRHPSVTANAIATVNELSNDRADLGIATGDSGVYSIGKTPARVSELRATVTKIQSLLAGDTVEFNGEEFKLEQQNGSVDVYIAAEGPRTLEMAGEVADGVIFGGGTKPKVVEQLGLKNIEKGAKNAGRSIEDIEIIVLAPACVSETKTEAVDNLMHILEPIAYHNFSFSVEDAPDELRSELRDLVKRHDMQEHGQTDAELPAGLSDEVRKYLGDRWAIAGSPAHCQERISALDNIGVDHAKLLFPTSQTADFMNSFEERVLQEM